MHKSVKQTNQGLNRPFGMMKLNNERPKLKLTFFHVSVAVFYYFCGQFAQESD